MTIISIRVCRVANTFLKKHIKLPSYIITFKLVEKKRHFLHTFLNMCCNTGLLFLHNVEMKLMFIMYYADYTSTNLLITLHITLIISVPEIKSKQFGSIQSDKPSFSCVKYKQIYIFTKTKQFTKTDSQL